MGNVFVYMYKKPHLQLLVSFRCSLQTSCIYISIYACYNNEAFFWYRHIYSVAISTSIIVVIISIALTF